MLWDPDPLPSAAGLSYRETGSSDAPPVLFLHGYPESSYMWQEVLGPVAAAGWRAVAPDLPGFGDSPVDPPGTWERHVGRLQRFRVELELAPVVLVVHDWGGLIGLRWACEYPDAVRALCISSTGFFADGKWHGLAETMRAPGAGERAVEAMTRERFGKLLASLSGGIDAAAAGEYWKGFADADRRRAQLELYRSGDFDKLRPYEGRLAALGVPVALIWGERDPFAPLAGAHRFERELPGARLAVLPGAGHFLVDDAPDAYAAELTSFLAGLE